MADVVALIGEKIGMSAVFTGKGVCIPVTAIKIRDNIVLGARSVAKDGYDALILAGGDDVKDSRVKKPLKSLFQSISATPRRFIREFRGAFRFDDKAPVLGSVFKVYDGLVGLLVDVSGVAQGKGFQGTMKRHGYSGLCASHGVSVSHRSLGSTGNRTDPGKVFKGKGMPGRMGGLTVTVQNMVIVEVDVENGVIFVKGSVPGKKGTLLTVRNAVKKHIPASIVVNGVDLLQK